MLQIFIQYCYDLRIMETKDFMKLKKIRDLREQREESDYRNHKIISTRIEFERCFYTKFLQVKSVFGTYNIGA